MGVPVTHIPAVTDELYWETQGEPVARIPTCRYLVPDGTLGDLWVPCGARARSTVKVETTEVALCEEHWQQLGQCCVFLLSLCSAGPDKPDNQNLTEKK